MMYAQYIAPLLFATVTLADYYIDNANTSVSYAMAPSQTGTSWETFSVSTKALELSITNSTGNYTILLDASHCYDENYALGVCGTGDNCYVELPFTGSGITMYVFNAGASGMTASFAVDGGQAFSSSIDAPPGPTFQVSNVSLYNVQGLTSGNHTMRMTILDWNGSPTSMKFDYAYVNESFVAAPATTSSTPSMTSTSASQTPSQTSTGDLTSSNKTNTGAIVGGSVGGAIALVGIVIGLLYFRKRRTRQKDAPASESTFQVNPFVSEYSSSPTPPLFSRSPDTSPSVPPLVRSAILRDALALATGVPSSSTRSIRSGTSSALLQPIPHPPAADSSDPRTSFARAHAGSPLSDPLIAQYNLTEEQLEVIDQLRADDVPLETIARVIEGFVMSRLEAGRIPEGSMLSGLAPPSYQTRER